jgi:hypothetical protein
MERDMIRNERNGWLARSASRACLGILAAFAVCAPAQAARVDIGVGVGAPPVYYAPPPPPPPVYVQQPAVIYEPYPDYVYSGWAPEYYHRHHGNPHLRYWREHERGRHHR